MGKFVYNPGSTLYLYPLKNCDKQFILVKIKHILLILILLRLSLRLESGKMCNNLPASKKVDKSSFLPVPTSDNDGSSPSGSSSQLCPIHGSNRTITRSLSVEDLYLFGGRRERQRSRSNRRRSTQIYRENSKKSSRKNRYSHQDPPPFLNFENEILKIVNSRKGPPDTPPQELLRNNSLRSSRKSSYNYSECPRSGSMSSYKKTSLSLNLPEEELLKHKRRRKIVTVIIVTFGILVFVCIMAVIVSLTHRSTVTVTRNNSTVNVTYYTFSPHAGVVCDFDDIRLW